MIMVIQHKGTPKKKRYAAKFLCSCGCVFLYQTKCPECGCTVSMVPNLELNIMPRNKIFDE